MDLKKIKIALVDDHKILLDGTEALLGLEPNYEVISKDHCIENFFAKKIENQIDVILMDFNMKEKDGIEVLRQLYERGFDGKCIFLSSYHDLKLVNECINTGANGYVTKSSATEHLIEAIDTVLKDEQYYSPDIKDKIINMFTKKGSFRANEAQERSATRQLTEREIEVLKLIALQYTSDEIAKKLFIAKSTVDTHRKNLIHKLQVKNSVGLGLFAERNGLI